MPQAAKTICVDNVEAKFLLFTTSTNDDQKRYVVSAEPIDTLARMERWPTVETMSVDYYEEDSSGKFFAFSNVDCFSPPVAIIRARSFEDAYESFCDEFERWMIIEEPDLADYDIDTDEPKCSFNSKGTPIDTEAVTGFEVRLVSIEC